MGEVPEIATFKNPFEETKKEDEIKGEKPEEYWQEDKFLYTNDFGEGLNGKKQPAIFVFNLKENSLDRL